MARRGGRGVQHRHEEVDRAERHRKMAASARMGPPSFDLAEWERQHLQAEQQTLRYGPDMRPQRLADRHQFAEHVADHTTRQAYRYF